MFACNLRQIDFFNHPYADSRNEHVRLHPLIVSRPPVTGTLNLQPGLGFSVLPEDTSTLRIEPQILQTAGNCWNR